MTINETAAKWWADRFEIEDKRDIWTVPWSSTKPPGHPAEKPVALVGRMIRESGARYVLDPFLGSGTTLEAAKQEGVTAVGIEVEERWCEVAAKRLQQQILLCTANATGERTGNRRSPQLLGNLNTEEDK